VVKDFGAKADGTTDDTAALQVGNALRMVGRRWEVQPSPAPCWGQLGLGNWHGLLSPASHPSHDALRPTNPPLPCLPPTLRMCPTEPLCLSPSQAAVAAANSQPGVVYLPAGTYRLTQPLLVTTSGVVIRGAGVSGRALAVALYSLHLAGCLLHCFALHCVEVPVLLLPSQRLLLLGPGSSPPLLSPHSCLPSCFPSLQEGSTRIAIPHSLSEVYPGSWAVDSQGACRCFLLPLHSRRQAHACLPVRPAAVQCSTALHNQNGMCVVLLSIWAGCVPPIDQGDVASCARATLVHLLQAV